MINEILNANLEQISRYNPELSIEIANFDTLKNNISLCETKSKEPNLLYGLEPIHSTNGAETEAKKIFKSTKDDPNTIHLIYGLGLGYLFKEFCENSRGKIILFEPDIEMLRLTLDVVDFSKELAQKNVFIVSNFETLEIVFYNTYAYGGKTKMHFLNFHKLKYPNRIQAVKDEITRLHSIISSNTNFQKQNNYLFLNNTIDALEKKVQIPPLSVLKNKFENIPAIIVSAGPSLGKNIEILKKYQDKAIIFCVGTAYKTLMKSGIKPDFLNVIEMYDCSTQIENQSTEDVNFISEAYTNKKFHEFQYKSKFLTLSKENIANIWFSKLIKENIDIYETKGTVSYNALNSAKILGCNPIILLGQDLAYTDGKCYAENSAYSSLRCQMNPTTNKPEIVVDNFEDYRRSVFGDEHSYDEEKQKNYVEHKLTELNESLAFVKGQNGNILPTEQGYALFIEYFKDFAKRNNESTTLINASIDGAYIDGYEHLPLEVAIEFCRNAKPNINELIAEVRYEFDCKTVSDNLKREINLASSISEILGHAQIDLRNLKREILRHKANTPKSNKYLKNCLDTFIKISQDFKPNNPLVYAVSMDEEVALNWILKEYDGNFEYEVQLKIIRALEDYFIKNHEKFTYIAKRLDESLKLINNLNLTGIC